MYLLETDDERRERERREKEEKEKRDKKRDENIMLYGFPEDPDPLYFVIKEANKSKVEFEKKNPLENIDIASFSENQKELARTMAQQKALAFLKTHGATALRKQIIQQKALKNPQIPKEILEAHEQARQKAMLLDAEQKETRERTQKLQDLARHYLLQRQISEQTLSRLIQNHTFIYRHLQEDLITVRNARLSNLETSSEKKLIDDIDAHIQQETQNQILTNPASSRSTLSPK